MDKFKKNFCGFDAALWTTHSHFWRYLGHPTLGPQIEGKTMIWPSCWQWLILGSNLPSGISLKELSEVCERALDHVFNQLPQVCYNVLIQYKRSEYMRSPRSLEWEYWKRPYYRYRLTQWQLKTLARIAQQVEPQAIVVYAAPSFYTISDLLLYAGKQNLVANSNFRRATDLERHRVYTFIEPGSSGMALSKPEKFSDDFHFSKEIELLASPKEKEFHSNKEYIQWLSRALEKPLREELFTEKLYKRYEEILLRLSRWPLTQSLMRINLISWIVQTRVLLGFAN